MEVQDQTHWRWQELHPEHGLFVGFEPDPRCLLLIPVVTHTAHLVIELYLQAPVGPAVDLVIRGAVQLENNPDCLLIETVAADALHYGVIDFLSGNRPIKLDAGQINHHAVWVRQQKTVEGGETLDIDKYSRSWAPHEDDFLQHGGIGQFAEIRLRETGKLQPHTARLIPGRDPIRHFLCQDHIQNGLSGVSVKAQTEQVHDKPQRDHDFAVS